MPKSDVMLAARVFAVSVPFALLTAAGAAAQTPATTPTDITTLSMQDLLDVDVVSTASKFPQEVREAPASITVITREDIHRYGYRNLADVLGSVRGFYTTYDRNYSYLGVRGFSRPGDYNTRFLLLVDGRRLNDGIYDMAPIGTDFPIDVSLIERIEVIRGPGSSLYGTSAFFAVVNVFTSTGANRKGLQLETRGGSLHTGAGMASFGGATGSGVEFLVGGSIYGSRGQGQLHFPEFDNGEPGSGLASDIDGDESVKMFASMSAGRVSIRASLARREKQVPTASFGTIFGDDREVTTDRYASVSAVYEGPIGRNWLATARVAFDDYEYGGSYPGDYGAHGKGVFVDGSIARTLTSELTARRRVARVHLITSGAEVRHQVRNRQFTEDILGESWEINTPGTNLGAYVQDEVRLRPWLLATIGGRVDRIPGFGVYAAPRAGLVILPREQTALKFIYGRAFRAPNAYELYYFTVPEPSGVLAPEQIRSSEFVWEESPWSNVRTVVTAFAFKATRIIEPRMDAETAQILEFENRTTLNGMGIEAEVEARLPNGLTARVSHTFAHLRDQLTETRVSNSPDHVSKFGVQIPVARLFLSVEGQYIGQRLTLDGGSIPGFFAPNVTLTSPLGKRVGVTLSVYNAFNRAYSDPGGAEHLQASIPQDGRTVMARLRVGF
jgi:outer membrane receptor for ferrienterochelin and colicins